MYSVAALLDVHARTHRCLVRLLAHCAGFEDDALRSELDGFGYPTILLQLRHVIGAERYWIGVLQGRMLVDEDEADRASIAALSAFRERTAATTVAWLRAEGDAGVGAARRVTTWGGREAVVTPAHVLLRTQTHVFQHQGQVAAMCRLLGRPIPAGLDFPLQTD